MPNLSLKQKVLGTIGASLLTVGIGGISYMCYSGYKYDKEVSEIVVSENVKEVKRLEDLLHVQNFPRGKRRLTSQEFIEVVNQYQVLTNDTQVRKDVKEYDTTVEKIKESWPLAEVPFMSFMLFYAATLISAGFFALAIEDKKKQGN